MAASGKGKPLATRRPTFTDRPLLAAPMRWPAGLLVAACAIVIATLGTLTAGQTTADWLDARIDGVIMARLGPHVHLDELVVTMGNQHTATIICALLVLALLALRRPRAAVLVVVAVPAAIVLTEYLLKPLFDRRLLGDLSFPSGHETVVSAMAFSLIVALTGPARPALPAALRWLAVAVAVAAMLALAPALIALQYHYFTDTIGGVAVGLGTVLTTALGLDALTAWLARSRSRPGSGAAQRPADEAVPADDGMTAGARGLPPA